jgi:ribosomal protein S14
MAHRQKGENRSLHSGREAGLIRHLLKERGQAALREMAKADQEMGLCE